jgi:hypothetical protein
MLEMRLCLCQRFAKAKHHGKVILIVGDEFIQRLLCFRGEIVSEGGWWFCAVIPGWINFGSIFVIGHSRSPMCFVVGNNWPSSEGTAIAALRVYVSQF